MNQSNYLLRRSTANQNPLFPGRFTYVVSGLPVTLSWTQVQHSQKSQGDKWHLVFQRETPTERKQDK